MNDVRIEAARESDLGSILEIDERFKHEHPHRESYLEEGIAFGRVFIARSDEEVAGYLIYHLIWGNTPFLALVRVLQEFQGRGIGRALIGELERTLRAEGFKALISSSTVNESANDFHEKMGFRKIGALPMIYGVENFYRRDL
jgi:GNAT superfamily N-acetyltransferase